MHGTVVRTGKLPVDTEEDPVLDRRERDDQLEALKTNSVDGGPAEPVDHQVANSLHGLVGFEGRALQHEAWLCADRRFGGLSSFTVATCCSIHEKLP